MGVRDVRQLHNTPLVPTRIAIHPVSSSCAANLQVRDNSRRIEV